MDEGKNVTLRLASEGEKSDWDSLVDASPHGTVFHTWDWVSAMGRHARMKLLGQMLKPVLHPLIAEHEGKNIGLIPLYEFKGRFISYVFSPPPHTLVTYLGPCLNFPQGMKQSSFERLHRSFQNAVDDYITGMGADCARIRPPPGFEDARPYLWQGYEVTPLYNYVIRLQRPTEEIFQGSELNFRNKVRKTEKEGYTIKDGSWEDMEKLFNHQKARYGEQELPMSIELGYLKDLWEHVPEGRLRILVIESGSEYVSGSIEAYYREKVYGWIGTPKIQARGGSPNDLLTWEVIKRAASQGYMEYENIWANEERLNPFKTKLNPHLNRYYSVVRMSRTMSLVYQVKKSLFGGKTWGAGL